MNAKLPAEQNLEILSHVAAAIGELRETLVFVGGCGLGFVHWPRTRRPKSEPTQRDI